MFSISHSLAHVHPTQHQYICLGSRHGLSRSVYELRWAPRVPLRAGHMRRIGHPWVYGRDVDVLHAEGADSASRVLVYVSFIRLDAHHADDAHAASHDERHW